MDGTPGTARLPYHRLIRAASFDATGTWLFECPRAFDELVDPTLTRIAYDPESFPVAAYLPWAHPDATLRTALVPCPDGRTLVLWFRAVGDTCFLEFVGFRREKKEPS